MHFHTMSFTNSLPSLFGQAAFVTILCLLGVELGSYLCCKWSVAKLKKCLKHLVEFKEPWDFAVVFTWLVLAFLSILSLRNASPVSSTYLAGGVVVFLLGF